MRTFTHGTGTARKFVVIEVQGRRMAVTHGKADGTTARSEKELVGEAEARAACEKLAGELVARGFVEQASSAAKARPAVAASSPRPPAAPAPPARAAAPRAAVDLVALEDDEEPAEVAPVIPRLATAPGAGAAAGAAPKKKKKAAGKKKKKPKAAGDGLDKRVIAGAAAAGVALLGFIGYFVYDTFLRPPSIVGVWQGSRLEYEIGRAITHNKYGLILDDQGNASLTLQEDYTSTGTYAVKGDRLKLTLKDKGEEGDEGEAGAVEYKISLGHATLDLYDPTSGKKVVELVRQRDNPAPGGGGKAGKGGAAPKDLAVGGVGEGDKAADGRLASVEFAPKDGAFKVKHPPGWEVETGSRPDNTYSWGRFTKGSAKIQVSADIAGSLMSGSDSAGQHEEGSELAPVHRAHELHKRAVAEEYSDYQEGKPVLFKGAPLGEGRIAAFTASGGGLFGSKLRGYRVTLLSRDRRVTVLCECPEKEFEKLKPTFLAVARSASH